MPPPCRRLPAAPVLCSRLLPVILWLFPEGLRQPSAISHRVVVCHGLAHHRARRVAGLSDHVLSHQARISTDDNPSAFTPHQLLIAHCAISDPKRGRTMAGPAHSPRRHWDSLRPPTDDTHVWIDRWSLKHDAGTYTAKIDAEDFSFDLTSDRDTGRSCSNGESGFSRKGPGRAGGKLLLQPAASTRGRQRRRAREAGPRDGRGMARP